MDFSNFNVHINHLVKMHILIQWVQGGIWASTFLTSSQVVLILWLLSLMQQVDSKHISRVPSQQLTYWPVTPKALLPQSCSAGLVRVPNWGFHSDFIMGSKCPSPFFMVSRFKGNISSWWLLYTERWGTTFPWKHKYLPPLSGNKHQA